MKKVLLVLSISRTSTKALDYAVSEAKRRGAELVALYIIDTSLVNEVFDRFTDIGFIGDRPSMEISEAIMKEYRQRGYEELGKVQIKAMEEGVAFDPIMDQGDYVEKVLEVMRKRDIELAVLVRRKRKPFMRYFSRSLVEEVRERAPCRVEIFEEEE